MQSVVNRYGCPKPLANNFDLRPDFDSIDLREGNRSFEIGRSQFGKISFQNKSISLLNATPASATARLDFDSNLQIEQNKITLNSTNLPNLNQPATLTFYNTSITRPKVLKDGVLCTTCTFTKDGSTITVTVSGFSTYELLEDAEVTSNRGGGGGGGGKKKVIPKAVAGASTLALPDFSKMTKDQVITWLKAKIAELIIELNAQIAREGLSPNTSNLTPNTFVFSTDLSLNMNHPDVWHLQRFLNTHGYPVGTNVGSYGKEVNTFGPVTKQTLQKFQKANGINPTGYFGPVTRERVNGMNK